jgi:hypothetical protein
MDSTVDSKSKLKWVYSIGKFVGLVGGLSLTCSLIYDWGFFHAANLNFQEIPSSISDHLRSSLNWLPTATIAISIFLILELFLQRVELGMTEEEIIQRSKNPERTRKFRESPKYIIIAMAIIILIGYIMFGELYANDLSFPLVIVWLIFSVWVNNHPRIKERRSPEIRLMIRWLPPIMIFLFFMGQNNFESILKNTPKTTVYYKSASDEKSEVSILRNLERGILVYEHKRNKIIFIGWAFIQKIENTHEKKYFRGIISKYIPKINALYDKAEKELIPFAEIK